MVNSKILREAKANDIPEMFELHKEFIKKMMALRPDRYFLHPDEESVFGGKISGWIESSDSRVVVYEKDGKVVGFGICMIEENPSFCKYRKYGNAYYAVVKKSLQGKGIGSEIVEDMIKFFKSKGVRQVEGTIDIKNEQSLSYMEKSGFSKEISVVVRDI